MKRPRRTFLHLVAGAAALPAVSRIAMAQAYPTRPVHIVVAFAPGGSHDILARLTGQWLSEHLGQPFIIENRPGANGTLGIETVVRSAADGYTMLTVGFPQAINTSLYDKLSFNLLRDIAPVAGVMRAPNIMVLNPSVPAKNVAEFIDYAKTNPGKINFASAGKGPTSHVAGELFKMMTGVEMQHVPYRGGAPAVSDVIGGQVQLMFATLPSALEHVRAGKLRGQAVTTAMRSDQLPETPTIGDFVPSYEVSDWVGFGVPRNTPAEVVEKLTRQINAMVADLKMRERLTELGGTALLGDFGKVVAAETEKWGKVVKFAAIKPE
jgi:tripartite-type tricarboxylate transporter receptor subunit TctC